MIFDGTSDTWEEEKKYVVKPSTSESTSKSSGREIDSDSEDEIGPPLPPQMKKRENTDDDEDIIGPPPPPSLKDKKDAQMPEKMKVAKPSISVADEDDLSDDEDELVSYTDVSLVVRITSLTSVLFFSLQLN